jgi:thymidylate synthase
MRHIVSHSTSQGWLSVLRDVLLNHEYETSPRGFKIREVIDYSIEIGDPSSKPVTCGHLDIDSKIQRYTEAELELYESKTLLATEFARASKFWLTIANPDGTVNSNYGYLAKSVMDGGQAGVSGWQWTINTLRKDMDSRQAIIHYNRPMHMNPETKDFPCTICTQYFIRENKLHAITYMRSNDARRGLPYDLSWFCKTMEDMLVELKEYYPNLTLGKYRHHAGSMHLYERDWPEVEKILSQVQIITNEVVLNKGF